MSTIRLRQATEKDIDAIKKLLAARFSTPIPIRQMESRLDMWWTDNPAMDDQTPPGWILEDSQKRIVGFIANIPVHYQIYGKKDTAVAFSHRSRERDRGILFVSLFQMTLFS